MEIWKISISVKDEATVDAFVDMYIIRYTARGVLGSAIYHIQREASALLVQQRWAVQSLQVWDE